jgi:hypothetical protein
LKAYRVLRIVGYFLILFGLSAFIWQGFLSESSGTTSMTIPSGPGYYVAFYTKSSMWMNAHFEGTITVDTGTVNMYFLNAHQYATYTDALNPGTSLWSSLRAAQGTFSLSSADIGKYYITVDHFGTNPSMSQTVTLTYKITGINLLYVIIGAILLMIGAIVTFVGFRMKKKETESLPLPPPGPVTEVKMFDSKERLQ